MHNNPIFRIEWLREGRGIRLPLLLIFYDALLAFVTILFMLFGAESLQEGYSYGTSSYLYQFLIISSFQMAAVFLLMPFLVTGSCAADKENHMLEQYRMIPGAPRQFILAKIVLVVSVNFLIFLSSLPIVTLSCLYTGISLLKLIRLCLMILLYSFWSGAISLFFYSVSRKLIWGFAGSAFAQMLFMAGTVMAAELLRNLALTFSASGEIPKGASALCLVLFAVNPIATYLGFYGNLTGDAGIITTLCGYMGIDASGRAFSFLFYKVASLICVLVGILFLALSVWYLERKKRVTT